MILKTIQKEIHERALGCAREFKRAEAELLAAIEAADREKVYRALGYASMFEYCVQDLRLSESTALNFIVVARKSREIPAIQERIANGVVSVGKMRRILPVLTPENQDHWLKLVSEAPQRAVEKEVARVLPRESVRDRVSYVNGTRLQMQVGVSERLMLRLRQIQDLESQRLKKAVSLEEALDAMAALYLDKKDPVKKAERAVARKGLVSQAEQQGTVEAYGEATMPKHEPKRSNMAHAIRQPIPAALKHTVMLKNQGQCAHTHSETGARCTQKRWLEIHHIKPVSHGGENTPQNLTLLCSNHHKAEHI